METELIGVGRTSTPARFLGIQLIPGTDLNSKKRRVGPLAILFPRTNYASAVQPSPFGWFSFVARCTLGRVDLAGVRVKRNEKEKWILRAFSATLPGRKIIGPNRGWLFHHPVHGIMADSHVSSSANGNSSRCSRRPLSTIFLAFVPSCGPLPKIGRDKSCQRIR